MDEDPAQCRDNATQALQDGDPAAATAWALLAIGGDLARIRRDLDDMRREMTRARRAR